MISVSPLCPRESSARCSPSEGWSEGVGERRRADRHLALFAARSDSYPSVTWPRARADVANDAFLQTKGRLDRRACLEQSALEFRCGSSNQPRRLKEVQGCLAVASHGWVCRKGARSHPLTIRVFGRAKCHREPVLIPARARSDRFVGATSGKRRTSSAVGGGSLSALAVLSYQGRRNRRAMCSRLLPARYPGTGFAPVDSRRLGIY